MEQMAHYKLTESEYRFATVVWAREPIPSGELAAVCRERLGWKKSTTYTVLKTLCEKGVLKNENAVVGAAAPMERVQRAHGEEFLRRAFGGSLPQFVASFLGDGKAISPKELEELRSLLDHYEERD